MKCKMKLVAITLLFIGLAAPLWAQEVIVIGSQKEAISQYVGDKWWAHKKRGQQLKVPYKMVVAIAERWQKFAPELPVGTKKEIFFYILVDAPFGNI